MKNLITGIAVATASTLAASATGAVSKLGAIQKTLGNVRVSLGLSGVMSKKHVKTTSTMMLNYTAGYLYAPEGVATLGQARGEFYAQNQVAPVAAGVTQSPALGTAIMTLRVNGVASVVGQMTADRQAGGLLFLYNGELPTEWIEIAHVTAGAVPVDLNNARAGAAAVVINPTWEQMMLGALSPHGADFSDERAGVAPGKRAASSEATTSQDVTDWGLRPELQIGYMICGVEIFLGARYLFDITSKDNKDRETVTNFTVARNEQTIQAQDGASSLTADLVRASFAFNNYQMATGVTVRTKVKETASFVGGLKYQPTECLGVSILGGVKRYTLDVSYVGGDYAYPGTVGMFSDNFTKSNDRYKLLLDRKSLTRSLKGTKWTWTIGGELFATIACIHNIRLGLEYSSFSHEWTADSKSSTNKSDDKKSDNTSETKGTSGSANLNLSTPYSAAPGRGDYVNGTGIHQFAATDAVNSIAAKVEVSDLTITAGYVLTL